MGQYFKAVNLDTQEFACPNDYNTGIKLMEHSWLLNPMVNAIMTALSPAGPWYRSRLVWAGDYMDEDIFLEFVKHRLRKNRTLYSCCHYPDEKLPGISCVKPTLQDGPVPELIVNHDTKQFVRLIGLPEEYPDDPGWHVHPLPLLTCSGNGRGGGDFKGDNIYVGVWAGDHISAEYAIPRGCQELIPHFTERQP